jgi:hypothetical protein
MGYSINKDGSVSKYNTSSVMERFPEYQFRPTTLAQPKFRLKLFVLFSILECIAMFLLASLVFFLCVEIFRIEPEYVIVVPWIIWLGGSFIAIRNTRKKWYKKVDLIKVADYCQTKGRKLFFVREGRMGVLDAASYDILVNAIYDKLSWVENGQILRAELNGYSFLIDIHNNRLK